MLRKISDHTYEEEEEEDDDEEEFADMFVITR